jgi:hypothetical protein
MTPTFHFSVIPGRRIGEPGISGSGPGASCVVRDFDATDKIPGSGDAGPGMTMRGGCLASTMEEAVGLSLMRNQESVSPLAAPADVVVFSAC